MPVSLAYFGVVLIWSTTPLAIVWSTQASGFIFGLSSRMLLGTLLAIIFSFALKSKIVWHRQAILAYIYGGLGIYGGMMSVYWAAQYIPSGWVSLLFGLTPIFSAIMASWWLEGELMTRYRLMGMLLGLVGLAFIFSSSLDLQLLATLGIGGVLVSGMIHSASAVWVKRTDANISAIAMTAGSLLFVSPLFLITWLLSDTPPWQTLEILQQTPLHISLSILYLSLFGSVFGFTMYYYVLKHVEATRVALISLLTPITSLILGHFINHESINLPIYIGAAFIISGLAVFEFAGKPLPQWISSRFD